MQVGKTKKTRRNVHDNDKADKWNRTRSAGCGARRTHTFTDASQRFTLQSSTAYTVSDLAHTLQTQTGGVKLLSFSTETQVLIYTKSVAVLLSSHVIK
jgi:hypothetical protein